MEGKGSKVEGGVEVRQTKVALSSKEKETLSSVPQAVRRLAPTPGLL